MAVLLKGAHVLPYLVRILVSPDLCLPIATLTYLLLASLPLLYQVEAPPGP